MTTRFRLVCFDFQDTLARFREGDAYDLYREAAREHGLELTREALRMHTDDAWAEVETPEGPDHTDHSLDEASYVALRARVHARRLVAAGVDQALAEQIGRRIDQLEAQPERYELYDDTIPALRAIGRMGVQSIIISNHIWRFPDLVRALGLSGLVEGVLTSARVGVRKPHARIFQQALQLARVPPEEALMVGDNLDADVRGPERVGMRAVLLDRDPTRAAPDGVRVIRSLRDLPLTWE